VAHYSIFKDRLCELGLLNPESLRLLSELSHQQMNATEEDAMGEKIVAILCVSKEFF
jgi:hypothetical protein